MSETGTSAPNGACLPTDVKHEDAVFIAMELGESILKCGGEISRTEDTISRICKAYGAVTVDVIAILSVIIITADFDDGSINSSRRISDISSNNLGRLSRLNDLSRRVCRERPSKAEFLKQMENITGATQVSLRRYMLGSMLTSFGFAIFFSDIGAGLTFDVMLGCVVDGLLSALIAFPLGIIAKYLSSTKTNAVIAKFLVCFLGGILAILIGRTEVPCHVDIIMIGNIMNFISGVAMTNSFRDVFSGDIMSGVFRLCSTLVDTVAIAFGYAVAILIFGGAI